MNGTLQLAADIFWVSMISGVVVWLFIRSFKRSVDRPRLIFKWAVTAVVVALVLFVVVPDFREGGDATFGALILMLICGLAMVHHLGGHILSNASPSRLPAAWMAATEPPNPNRIIPVALTKR